MAAPAFLKQAAAALAAAARQAPAGSLLASPARQSLLQALRGVAICRPYAANAAGEAAGSVEATERAIQEYNHERAGVAGERLVPKWFNAKSAKPKTSTDAANKGVRQNLYMSMVLVGVTLMLFVRDFLNPEEFHEHTIPPYPWLRLRTKTPGYPWGDQGLFEWKRLVGVEEEEERGGIARPTDDKHDDE